MTEDQIRELTNALSDLRHAYTNLIKGTVHPKNFKTFADGLISPAISKIERVLNQKPN